MSELAGDLGLFGPGSVTWKVHGEPILMVAGLRALLLQTLHPRALAGVVQNSDFRQRPWHRLETTVNYVVTVNYGTSNKTAGEGDYGVTSGSLTFAPGETSKTVAIVVKGDTKVENNEQFALNLSSAVNASLPDSQLIGTISNDD